MEQSFEEQWAEFIKKYEKQYDSEEQEENCRRIFESNLKMINEHNKNFKNGLSHYKMALNEFADFSQKDILNYFAGMKKNAPVTSTTHQPLGCTLTKLPESKDWRAENVVTAVKDQRGHNICWAISAVGSLESQIAIKTKKLNPLSAQNLVDCCLDYKPISGCTYEKAFEYIKKNGITTEAIYPYEGRKGICQKIPEDSLVKISGYVQIPQDEKSLLSAVATVGPISIGYFIDNAKFFFYDKGVFDNNRLKFSLENEKKWHAGLIVGYGSEGTEEYWLVKNSYGKNWGEEGYIKMSRNKANQCDVATYAFYPVPL